MKCFTILMVLASLVTTTAFAVETTTDCPMMREDNSRNNPKANLGAVVKPKTAKPGVIKQ